MLGRRGEALEERGRNVCWGKNRGVKTVQSCQGHGGGGYGVIVVVEEEGMVSW